MLMDAVQKTGERGVLAKTKPEKGRGDRAQSTRARAGLGQERDSASGVPGDGVVGRHG